MGLSERRVDDDELELRPGLMKPMCLHKLGLEKWLWIELAGGKAGVGGAQLCVKKAHLPPLLSTEHTLSWAPGEECLRQPFSA